MPLSTVNSFSFGFWISVFSHTFSLDLLMLEYFTVDVILFGVGLDRSALFSFHCLMMCIFSFCRPRVSVWLCRPSARPSSFLASSSSATASWSSRC
jgi:hypothetical protein